MIKPLGSGDLSKLLTDPKLGSLNKPGDQASVLSPPHQGHIDATLYQKGQDGRIYPVQKQHLDPHTFKPIKSDG